MWLGDTLHTRLVTWLKIVLPVTALGLLSTVFLVSRSNDPTGGLPFADPEMVNRATQQQITAPYFTGMTDRGDIITVNARRAAPSPESAETTLAEDVATRINTVRGEMFTLDAASTRLEQSTARALFEGGVHIDSSTGYQLRTERLQSALDVLHVESLAPVQGDGPAGRFTAGKMLIHAPNPGGAVQFLFTEGVHLIYDPKQ
ncbi:MAG: hypothetical protein ACPGVS_04380 [Primorskyibacter sp.]